VAAHPFQIRQESSSTSFEQKQGIDDFRQEAEKVPDHSSVGDLGFQYAASASGAQASKRNKYFGHVLNRMLELEKSSYYSQRRAERLMKQSA